VLTSHIRPLVRRRLSGGQTSTFDYSKDEPDMALPTTLLHGVNNGLLKSKRQSFWQSKLVVESSSPRQLWRSIDEPMGRGRVPLSAVDSVDEINRFFDEKAAGVRSSTLRRFLRRRANARFITVGRCPTRTSSPRFDCFQISSVRTSDAPFN